MNQITPTSVETAMASFYDVRITEEELYRAVRQHVVETLCEEDDMGCVPLHASERLSYFHKIAPQIIDNIFEQESRSVTFDTATWLWDTIGNYLYYHPNFKGEAEALMNTCPDHNLNLFDIEKHLVRVTYIDNEQYRATIKVKGIVFGIQIWKAQRYHGREDKGPAPTFWPSVTRIPTRRRTITDSDPSPLG